VFGFQTFVTLGPASLLVFAELLCIVSVGVYASLWYLGRHTDKHCGQYNKLCGRPPQYAPAPCKLTLTF